MVSSVVTSSKLLQAKVLAYIMQQERLTMKQLHISMLFTQLAVKELPVQAVQAVKKGKSIFFTTVSHWHYSNFLKFQILNMVVTMH